MTNPISRRKLLERGALGTAAMAAVSAGLVKAQGPSVSHEPMSHGISHSGHTLETVGDIAPGGLDPDAFLTHFDYGEVSRAADGRVMREYEIVALDREIEVAPGV